MGLRERTCWGQVWIDVLLCSEKNKLKLLQVCCFSFSSFSTPVKALTILCCTLFPSSLYHPSATILPTIHHMITELLLLRCMRFAWGEGVENRLTVVTLLLWEAHKYNNKLICTTYNNYFFIINSILLLTLPQQYCVCRTIINYFARFTLVKK